MPPDAFFLETAVEYCMRTIRVSDCFYFYGEMVRRGMQPRARQKGHLVSVLARAGRIKAAAEVSAARLPVHTEQACLASLLVVMISCCSIDEKCELQLVAECCNRLKQ